MRTTPLFLTWHFVTVPREILIATRNLAIFVLHFFSVPLLLTTFFAPWKRETEEDTSQGFNLQKAVDAILFNLYSRVLGAIVRCTTILLALVLSLTLVVFGLALFTINLALPIVSLPAYLSALKQDEGRQQSRTAGRNPAQFVSWFFMSPRGVFLATRLEQPITVIKETLSSNIRTSTVPPPMLTDLDQPSAVFLKLVSEWQPLVKTCSELRIAPDDIETILHWYDRLDAETQRRLRFWDLNKLLHAPSVATDWAYGFTPTLDQCSIDLMKEQARISTLAGRTKLIERIETILAREQEDNVILVGEPGVGKRTVCLQLAQMISEGHVLPHLAHRRIVELNLTSYIGDAKSEQDIYHRVERLLTEAHRAGNIILVIPSIDRYLTPRDKRLDLSPVFSRLLTSNKLQVIGTATTEDYQKYLVESPLVGKLFEKIDVLPPSESEAMEILEDFSLAAEQTKHVVVSYAAIKETITVSEQYVTNIPFPEKALDILDEAIAVAVSSKKTAVKAADIDRVISDITRVPVGDISHTEQDKLVKLEELMHRRLIGQEQAVTDLSNTLRRTRLSIGKRQKPAGVFLFLGPTGVGKTETAKTLAAAYFGNERSLVRLDMNEFHDAGATIRLLGDFSTREPGIMAVKLREHPFCVLLLDEIEKASGSVLNLLLTAFDEGYVTDNFGKKIDLRNMLIIATSNAGSELIRENIAEGRSTADFKRELIDALLREKVFSPEFLNRFDSVVVYKPLTHEQLKDIARLMLMDLNEQLKEKEIQVKVTDKLLEDAVRLSYDPAFGARPLRRFIQDKIEAPIAEKILKGMVKRGEEVEMTL